VIVVPVDKKIIPGCVTKPESIDEVAKSIYDGMNQMIEKLTGEKNTTPKKNPTHVEQHIIQDNMSIKNFHWLCIKLPSSKDFSRMKFLGPLKIDP
jgi:predicted RNase H-like HicB family nuclease